MMTDREEFERLALPLMRWLRATRNPHTSVIVTSACAEMVSGEMSVVESDERIIECVCAEIDPSDRPCLVCECSAPAQDAPNVESPDLGPLVVSPEVFKTDKLTVDRALFEERREVHVVGPDGKRLMEAVVYPRPAQDGASAGVGRHEPLCPNDGLILASKCPICNGTRKAPAQDAPIDRARGVCTRCRGKKRVPHLDAARPCYACNGTGKAGR